MVDDGIDRVNEYDLEEKLKSIGNSLMQTIIKQTNRIKDLLVWRGFLKTRIYPHNGWQSSIYCHKPIRMHVIELISKYEISFVECKHQIGEAYSKIGLIVDL